MLLSTLRSFKFKLTCSLLLIITLLTFYYVNRQSLIEDENLSFETYTYQLFLDQVTSDTLTLYYSISDLESFHITAVDISLGSYDIDPMPQQFYIENQLLMLSTFSYENLNYENQLTYDILQYQFTLDEVGTSYILYDEPLTPYTGIHTQLPILLAEFPLDSKDDVETYLALLKTLPDYFSSLIAFEQEKASQGLFMSDSQLTTVLEECNGFIFMEDNYLVSTFDSRLEAISELTDSERSLYSAENEAIISAYVIPTSETLVNALESLSTYCTPSLGLCYLEYGRNYYAYLVEASTGSSRTVPEIQVLIQNQMLYDLLDLQEATAALDSGSFTFPEINGNNEELLASLESSMEAFFPTAPTVTVTIKDIPSELEAFLSPAFYLIPTIDFPYENTIYINNGQMEDDLTLYTTLAHEGYPGHLYQTTYYASTEPDYIRSVLHYGGYVEGWAVYTEMCSYYFGAISSPEDTILQKSASLNLGLCAYTDIGVHYEGWTLDDTIAFFNSYGITNEETISFIYELVIASPGNYLKYYLGYVELLELKLQCIQEWGTDFTQLQFHQAVLDVGPAPFDILSDYVLSSY